MQPYQQNFKRSEHEMIPCYCLNVHKYSMDIKYILRSSEITFYHFGLQKISMRNNLITTK